jgi:hypothetical protein
MYLSSKKALYLLLIIVACALLGFAQSSDQNFPTPITSNELNGTIRARDLGDPRSTTYYYAFDGTQGDIFINVVVKNLSGDIDIFTLDGLQPLTKMVFYADIQTTETGRLVYLRKPERLLLRVQGRPPADEPATFRIRFGGSFVALAPRKGDAAPKLPERGEREDTGVRVNSVGTILEVTPRKDREKADDKVVADTGKAELDKKESAPPTKAAADDTLTAATDVEPKSKPKVVVTEPDVPTLFGNKKTTKTEPAKSETAADAKKPPPRNTRSSGRAANPPVKKTADPPAEKAPDPLASIFLVVELKSGEVIQLPMSDVVRFSVDKGVLSVLGKDGKTQRYSILLVSKVTIQ